MRNKNERTKLSLIWILLGASFGLWMASVSNTTFSALSFATPFIRMGISFWVGLTLGLCVFFVGNNLQKSVGLFILALYFIATVSIVFNYPIMHDSINNVENFGSFATLSGPYSQSYWGFSILISWLKGVTGADSWTIARFFPFSMVIVYLLTFGMISLLWRKKI